MYIIYKEGNSIYIILNFSDYKNNYNARKSYIEKIIYVGEIEEKTNNHNTVFFPILSYHIFEESIKTKLTSEDAKNNIHGEIKSHSFFQ